MRGDIPIDVGNWEVTFDKAAAGPAILCRWIFSKIRDV